MSVTFNKTSTGRLGIYRDGTWAGFIEREYVRRGTGLGARPAYYRFNVVTSSGLHMETKTQITRTLRAAKQAAQNAL